MIEACRGKNRPSRNGPAIKHLKKPHFQSFRQLCFDGSKVPDICQHGFRGTQAQSMDQCSNVVCLLKDLLHFHQIQDSDLQHRMRSQSVPFLLIINLKQNIPKGHSAIQEGIYTRNAYA